MKINFSVQHGSYAFFSAAFAGLTYGLGQWLYNASQAAGAGEGDFLMALFLGIGGLHAWAVYYTFVQIGRAFSGKGEE